MLSVVARDGTILQTTYIPGAPDTPGAPFLALGANSTVLIVDAPATVDVHIVRSTEAPSGCGEPPVPVIAPAVVNALYHLTGKRYRTLPLKAL